MTTAANPVKPTLAMLKNVAACLALVEKLRSRGPHLPGLGVFNGPSGYGKSYAAIYAVNKTRALCVEVGESWTRRTFLSRILAEAGLTARGTLSDMMDDAVMFLGDDPGRPVIIDEADKLVDKGMIELVRELHEHSQAPILLIGEEMLPSKLARSERTHNRVLDWVLAQPCDQDDAQALAELFCPGLAIAEDLLREIIAKTGGRARRIVVTLNAVQEYARNAGLLTLDLTSYRGRIFTGEPPVRGRRAA